MSQSVPLDGDGVGIGVSTGVEEKGVMLLIKRVFVKIPCHKIS
jgi:hypothetical protein